MKNLFILILAALATNSFGQAIEINTNYSFSNTTTFKNNYGIGIGYNQHLKSGDRVSLGINTCYNERIYDDVYGDAASMYLFIERIKSENYHYGINLSYGFNLVNNLKSSLFIGPKLGLNYSNVNQKITRYEYEDILAKDYETHYKFKNRIHTGILIEYEIKEVVFEDLSTFMSIQPELCIYPVKQGWLIFNIGIRYLFE
jgi:hypothetical protein